MILSLLILFQLVSAPPPSVKAYDTPNDGGGSITVEWELSPDDSLITRYEVYRAEVSKENEPKEVTFVARGRNKIQDNQVKNGVTYYYFVRAWIDSEYSDSEWSAEVVPKAQWFHKGRKSALLILLFYTAVLLFFLMRARKGAELKVRRIAGLDAIDDAVGRSTEMGRPILFSLGLGTISDVPTLAGLAILKRVAMKAAEYETDLIVPNFEPVVLVAAQEVVKEAYMEAGRPDLYDENKVFYLTYDQFGYAAGVDGIMLREKPGAIFFQGYFYAESLILAETGHSIGAIQISGTTAVTQLPFFIAATDYTLIGEEMYAASAYLSKDPLSLATIKGEDIAKVALVLLMGVGVILESLALWFGWDILHAFKDFFNLF
jgi:hypothetical protein